jgi:hypothetical protein
MSHVNHVKVEAGESVREFCFINYLELVHMKLIQWLKSLRAKPHHTNLTEEEIQRIHKDVIKDIRLFNAEKRRSEFKVIKPNINQNI